MTTKKLITTTAFLCAIIAVSQAQEMTIIKGDVTGDLKGYNKVYLYGKNHDQDSTEIVDGHFQFTFPYEKGFVPLLFDEFTVKRLGGAPIFPIVIDRPGTVEIKDIDINKGLYTGKLTGLKSAEDFQEYGDQEKAVMNEVNNQLVKKYGGMPAIPADGSSTPELTAFIKDEGTFSKKQMPALIEGFVKNHPDSYVSAFKLSTEGISVFSPADLKRVYNMLSKERQQSEEGKNIINYMEGLKKSETGKAVADFTLFNAQGKPVKFKDLRGKYILIDFWASWCGPCKESFPYMKEVYNKYKSDKFEIYSISIDKRKPDWIKELKKQQLPWLQSLDDKHIGIKNFGVSAVPATILISPDGKIIMKEIGLSPDGKMKKKLDELFAAK